MEPQELYLKAQRRCSETKLIHREKVTIAEEKTFKTMHHAHMDTHLFDDGILEQKDKFKDIV